MRAMTLDEVTRAVAGQLVGADPAVAVTGAAIDSRDVVPGDLFVALAGERTDGHEHVESAVEAGAVAVLASRPIEGPAVMVPDTEAALALLARDVLRLMPDVRIVGITGSSGKTTTKDLLAHVLAAAGPVHAPPGSFNTEVGLPVTVVRTPPGTRHLVLEYGARGTGHIRHLATIAPPEIAVVINVGSAHVGEFGSRELVAAAKAELLEGDGAAVLNADDPLVRTMPTSRSVLLVGTASDAGLRVADLMVGTDGRASFDLHYEGSRATVALRHVGHHIVSDAACAAGAALLCGLPLDVVASRLSTAEPVSRWRMEVSDRPDGITVINDAYNANPESMRAALEALRAVAEPAGRRSWAVLGEMRELGNATDGAHADLGDVARALGIDRVVTVGDPTGPLRLLAADAAAADADEAITFLLREIRPGDVVLVKASRSIGLERVAAGLIDGAVQGGAS
jgi:UDP-N-acetylmuramoyl-tripeptide--D-alanyl-D-alanine ligase